MNRFSYVELAILQIVQNESLHGYAITQKIQTISDGDLQLPAGSLYPALHKLERTGLLSSEYASAGKRQKKLYIITEKGTEVLSAEKDSWAVMVKVMNRLLEA